MLVNATIWDPVFMVVDVCLVCLSCLFLRKSAHPDLDVHVLDVSAGVTQDTGGRQTFFFQLCPPAVLPMGFLCVFFLCSPFSLTIVYAPNSIASHLRTPQNCSRRPLPRTIRTHNSLRVGLRGYTYYNSV